MTWESRKLLELQVLSQSLYSFQEKGKIVSVSSFVHRKDHNESIKRMLLSTVHPMLLSTVL
jgi:hypothetical protein